MARHTDSQRGCSGGTRLLTLPTTLAVVIVVTLHPASLAAAEDAYRFKPDSGALHTTWTNRFKKTSGFTGTDSSYSIPLNNATGRKLGANATSSTWSMFTGGDTFVGVVDTSVTPWTRGDTSRWQFVNNTLGLYDGSSRSDAATQLSFKWKGDVVADPYFESTDQEQMAMMPALDEADGVYSYFWPADGVVVPLPPPRQGYQLVQFWARMRSDRGLAVQSINISTWQLPSAVDPTSHYPYAGEHGSTWNSWAHHGFPIDNLWSASSGGDYTGPRIMGNAVLDLSSATSSFHADTFVYVYGVQGGDYGTKYGFVARSTTADLTDPSKWLFWNGSSFAATRLSDAAPLLKQDGTRIDDLASEFSVFQLPNGHYAMVYTKFDGYEDPAFAFTNIVVRTTTGTNPTPAGPWQTAAVQIYRVNHPPTGNTKLGLPDVSWFIDHAYWVYGGKAHPHLSTREASWSNGDNALGNGKLLISFNVNARLAPGVETTSSMGPAFHFADVYRPRFLTVDYYKVVGTPQ